MDYNEKITVYSIEPTPAGMNIKAYISNGVPTHFHARTDHLHHAACGADVTGLPLEAMDGASLTLDCGKCQEKLGRFQAALIFSRKQTGALDAEG